MADVDVDVLVHVYQIGQRPAIGTKSTYTSKANPGTGKTIQGWKWDQRTWPDEREFQSLAFAPSLWDATTSGIVSTNWQSGYGDGKDLLLLDIERLTYGTLNKWVPKIHPGYFYSYNNEWYLYSDCHITEYFTTANLTASGQQFIDLAFNLNPTVPIQIRQYKFDTFEGQHIVSLDFQKKLEFSASATRPEFIVDFDAGDTPRLILNGDYSQNIGVTTTGITGASVPADIAQLELLGISDGTVDQQFQTVYSPLDPYGAVEIWTWSNPAAATLWTLISGFQTFTSGDNYEARIDYDRGTVTFGDFENGSGDGHVPETGHRIGIRYTKGLAALYEPEHTCGYVLAPNADTNPVNSATNLGFVQVNTRALDPYSIVLTADLPQVNPFLIELGNNVGLLTATVKSRSGQTIEGQSVTFNILEPTAGSFGSTATSISAITDANGEANTFYNAPTTANGLGNATIAVQHDGLDTVITVSGVVEPGSISGIYLYKVHEEDLILGYPPGIVDTYYTDYLNEELIVSGTQATQTYEESYRTIAELPKPNSYTSAELSKGKKTIILTQNKNLAVHPHTGRYDSNTYTPLFPSEAVNVGTSTSPILQLTYEGIALDLPGTNDTKAYFIIGDSQTNIQANTINSRTNRTIYSNTIGMRVTIPDTLNGLFLCDTLSDIPSGLLTRAKNVDELTDVQILPTSGINELYEAWENEKLITQYAVTPPHVVSYRYEAFDSNSTDFGVELRKNSGTEIVASFSHEDVVSGSWTQASYFLTSTEISNITDYDDLSLTFSGIAGPGRTKISWAELTIGASPTVSGQQLRPDADMVDGGWLKITGDTAVDMYQDIDEASPDDSTYIYETSAAADAATFSLTSGLNPVTTAIYESYVDWFRRTRKGDTVVLTIASLIPPDGIGDSDLDGLDVINAVDCPSEIPLGWRLRSTGITVAAALDQVTFLDPNDHLPSGYFELKSKAGILGQEFTVTIV